MDKLGNSKGKKSWSSQACSEVHQNRMKPCQLQLLLTLMVPVSGRRWDPSSLNCAPTPGPRVEKAEGKGEVGGQPVMAKEINQQVSNNVCEFKMATASHLPSKSLTRIPLMVNPNQKNIVKEILRNVVQPDSIYVLQSHHTQHSLLNHILLLLLKRF